MPKASVNALRGKLYLLARLPKKSDESVLQPQRIPTGLNDTPADRKVAEKRRTYLQRQIDQGTFSWDDWTEQKGVTWKKGIDALYRKRVVLGRTGEETWEINYMGRLRQAPMTHEMTPQSIQKFMSKWRRDQCSYKETFYLLKDMCQLVGVTFPELPIPTYTTGQVTNVPSDQVIIELVLKAPPVFAWYIGMMATYGLRPHEISGCRFVDDKNLLWVDDKTKTGERLVIPLHAGWVHMFDLRNERRRDDPNLNQWMHHERTKLGMNFKPYALRHSYAGRLWKAGGSNLDVYTAARLMGHSMSEHEKTYRAWIAPYTIAVNAADAIQKNMESVERAVIRQLQTDES